MNNVSKQKKRALSLCPVIQSRMMISCRFIALNVSASGSTLVVSVGLVEALRVDKADSTQVQCVFLGQQVGLAISQLLVGHQGVIAIAHPHIRLQVGQLLSHLRLLSLQELWLGMTRRQQGKRKVNLSKIPSNNFFQMSYENITDHKIELKL